MNKELIFYDVEVFKYDSLVVFKTADNKEIDHFWNNHDRLHVDKYLDIPSGFEGISEVIKGKILVGYNNYHYDDYILSAMMNPGVSQEVLKNLSDSLIRGDKSFVNRNDMIESLDAMQQISVSHPSLKLIEGNMGRSIMESSIDFSVDQELDESQREEVLRYCCYDVENTIAVYNLRKESYFETKTSLVNMIGKGQRWNTTTLSSSILLGDKELDQWKEHKVPSKYWRNVQDLPDEVWDMWEQALKEENVMKKNVSKSIKLFGCTFVFGLGGLHAAPTKPGKYTDIKLADVGSMYPSIICKLNALEDSTTKYDEIRQERLRIKHSDPVKAGALKLILNSVYGLFKSQYSKLFNPRASATVCIYGQIALFTLCRELHKAGYELVNINTDGVAFISKLEDEHYKPILDAWEKEFEGLKLEVDYFEKWIQKDVNNYIALQDGKVKVKGGDVNKYAKNRFFDNNNCRIGQIAMVDYLLYQKPIEDTLSDNLDKPLLWQYVLKAGSTYKGVQDNQGEWQQKVNRIFACKEGYPYTKLYKIRQDDGQVNFPDVPERMFLWNENVNDIPDFENMIDLDYYYSLVRNKLKGWPADVY